MQNSRVAFDACSLLTAGLQRPCAACDGPAGFSRGNALLCGFDLRAQRSRQW